MQLRGLEYLKYLIILHFHQKHYHQRQELTAGDGKIVFEEGCRAVGRED